jgi:predicted Zn-ribbon and HTH transcriptional regulator
VVENKKKKNYDQYNKYQKRIRKERKQKLVEMFGGKCQTCGYNRSYKALDFHHVDSEGANCHRELDD